MQKVAAAHEFFALQLQNGGPLHTPSQAAFTRQREQLPPAQAAAFDSPAGAGAPPGAAAGAAHAAAIIHEVFGSSETQAVDRDAALDALRDSVPACIRAANSARRFFYDSRITCH